jgi:hypothetical protein
LNDSADQKPSITTSRWWQLLTGIGILFIAIGSASEAAFLIRDGYVEIYSIFSNQYEYDTLASINVGTTVEHAENLLGYPQVSRAIDPDTTANYFYTGEYLLTLFYSENRIVAYTWVSTDDKFTPEVDLQNGTLSDAGEFSFADIALEVKGYTLDDSRIVRYYLEYLEGGRTSGFVNTYLGNVQYGAFAPANEISKLYQAEVTGDEQSAEDAYTQLRNQVRPNLYGRGHLPLEHIEKAVLSNNEFTGYFGNN